MYIKKFRFKKTLDASHSLLKLFMHCPVVHSRGVIVGWACRDTIIPRLLCCYQWYRVGQGVVMGAFLPFFDWIPLI